MQALTALRPGGLLPLPASRRLSRPSRANLAVTAAKGKAPAEAPPAAAPAPAPSTDIPAYFQPAPAPQQGQGGQPQAYQAVPQYAVVQTPVAQPSFWSNIPPLVYIGVGVVLAGVLGKVMAVIKGGPQKMQEMAMQQMMQQMMKQMGGAPGGASPFGAPGANPFAAGGNPFGAPGANPFGAAGGGNPFGPGSPFGAPPPSAGSGFPSMQPAYDTTASPAKPAAPAASSSTAAPPSDSATATAGDGKQDKPRKKSAFVDVNAGNGNGGGDSSSSSKEGAGAGAGSSSSSSMPPPPFAMPPGGMPPFSMPGGGMPPPPSNMGGAAGAGAASGTGATGVAGTMLDMLKNPEMQKMLYPYLPEPMRNEETFTWMLSNPEYRQQLEGMLQQQAASSGSPAMTEMMQGMDMSPEKMQAQFDAMGMSPDQFITKVMGDPDLAQLMTNPKIMNAIAECTKNPMAIFNYQNDPEVLRVFEKMSAMFPQAAGAGALPNMPPGFGQPPQQ